MDTALMLEEFFQKIRLYYIKDVNNVPQRQRETQQ